MTIVYGPQDPSYAPPPYACGALIVLEISLGRRLRCL